MADDARFLKKVTDDQKAEILSRFRVGWDVPSIYMDMGLTVNIVEAVIREAVRERLMTTKPTEAKK